MKQTCSRVLALMLALVMVISMIPAAVFAEDTATTWTKVDFSAITAEDTVAITMSKDGVTYVLPTTAAGGSGQPMAEIGTVAGDTLTTNGDGFGWTIAPTEGGCTIGCENGYLYSENTNNGTRIGETAAVWNLDAESNYLATVVDDTMRYLGVYIKGLDWRCYKTWATGNTMGQTIGFWVKGGSAPVVPTEPTQPSEPIVTEPSEPVVTDPTQPAAPGAGEAVLVNELADGMKVFLYNPGNTRVLTDTPSGAVLASVPGAVENEVLTVEEGMTELTVTADASGAWLFANAEGKYLTAGTGSNMLTFESEATEYSLWNAEAVEGGFLVPNVAAKYNDQALYLEYYKENFTTYTYQQWNSKPYVMQFFCSGTASSGEFVSTLQSGDRVVIYNPTYSMGLSNEIQNVDKNYDLNGTPLTLDGDTLTGWGENNIFDVTVDAEGKVSFTDAAGQKLAVVSRTHLGFAEEATAWTLELVEGKTDEFYVGSGQGTYLEWYADKNYWSAYYNPSEAMYAIRFYAVTGNGGSVQPSNVVATPKAAVKAGVVDSGTEISFTCATEGATILYHTGDGNWAEYTAPIAIYDATTFTVKAVKEGMEDSKEVTFAYTIYVPPVLGEDQAVLVTDASQLQSGDRILIVTKDYDYALGTTQKDNNRDYAEVIKAYDKLSYNEFAQIITLESGVAADTWALYATNGENTGYLYAPEDSGNLLRTQAEKNINGSFSITINDDGTAAITAQLDKKSNTIRYNTVGIFSCYGATGQKPVCIYELIEEGNERPGLPAEGDQVVLYNQAAKGVLGGVDGDTSVPTSCTILASAAAIQGGKAICSNGALVFEVQKNGEYYRLFNASFGYLSSTGGGNNTFYSFDTADADWVVEEYNGGYRLGSRTAVFDGNMQYLQYFAEHFTTWGMYAVTDRDVFTYHFYPCASDKITDGVEWCKTRVGKDDVEKLVEKGKSQFVGPEIMGKKLGVIGLGAIGILVANAAKSLGMEVYGFDPYISVDAAWKLKNSINHANAVEEIYKECDYITIHVPLNASTKETINKDTIAMMKDGVRILNYSRDGLVNSADMLEALKSGKVAKYVTDFATDDLLCEEGVVAMPHLGASTPESEDNCAVMAVNEVMDYLENGNIVNSVNMPAVSLGAKNGARVSIIAKADAAAAVLAKVAELGAANVASATRGDYAYILAEVEANEAAVAIDGVIRVRAL